MIGARDDRHMRQAHLKIRVTIKIRMVPAPMIGSMIITTITPDGNKNIMMSTMIGKIVILTGVNKR
jgi:hypothetical protein